MEVVYIVPISGLLIALGVLLVLGSIWLWNLATEYENALIDFANESSDQVLLIVAVVIAILGLVVVIIQYSASWSKRLKGGPLSIFSLIIEMLVRVVSISTPFICGFLTIYGWSIFWINGIVSKIAESVLMWIAVPLAVIVFIVGVIIGLVLIAVLVLGEIGLLALATDDENKDSLFCRLLIPLFVEIVATAIFILLMYTCTDFPTYLANSLVS